MRGLIKILTFIAIGLLVAALAPAKTFANDAAPVGFFYEVEKDGQRSFILGSVHGGINPETLPALVRQAFRNSTTNVFEGDPVAFQSRYGTKMLTESLLSDNETLEDRLPQEVVQKLRQLLFEAGAELALKSKPWAVSHLLSGIAEENLKATGLNLSFNIGIDLTLLAEAKADPHKNIVYLSRPEVFAAEMASGYELEDLIEELKLPDPIGVRS